MKLNTYIFTLCASTLTITAHANEYSTLAQSMYPGRVSVCWASADYYLEKKIVPPNVTVNEIKATKLSYDLIALNYSKEERDEQSRKNSTFAAVFFAITPNPENGMVDFYNKCQADLPPDLFQKSLASIQKGQGSKTQAFTKESPRNTTLTKNEANCKKISGVSNSYTEGISKALQVSMSAITYRGTKWDLTGCHFMIDTPKGANHCNVAEILYDNKEKFAFASTDNITSYVACGNNDL